MTMVFASKQDVEALKRRIEQLDADMAAIAEAIKRNNVSTQAILTAIDDARSGPKLIGLDS